MARIIPISEVENLTGLKKSAIYHRIQKGKFPQPAKLSSKASRWSLAEVNAWIERMLEAREDG